MSTSTFVDIFGGVSFSAEAHEFRRVADLVQHERGKDCLLATEEICTVQIDKSLEISHEAFNRNPLNICHLYMLRSEKVIYMDSMKCTARVV